MWQRFTEEARIAIFHAQEEAQAHKQKLVDTEHLLLGLLKDRAALACRVLEHLGVSPDSVVAEVEKLIAVQKATSKDFALSPESKRVIDLTYAVARDLKHEHIGIEHMLAGLLREENGIGSEALIVCGVSYESVMQAIRDISSI